MKIHITEAMRLKNEISKQIRQLEYNCKVHIIMGHQLEDGVQSTEGEGFQLEDTLGRLTKALSYSEEINGKLADFNRVHGIDAMVRKMSNLKMLKEVYENLLPKTKPTKNNSWISVGDTRKQVVVEYRPLYSSKDIKDKINEHKQSIRTIQTQVETLNQEFIELSFDHTDVDNLSLD